MSKTLVNSDIYNLSKLVNNVKSTFLPNETEETLAVSTYGYIGALESHRLQTQVQMTGELCNEVFPSRARLERNVVTHAIIANINNINAIPAKMTVYLAIKETDLSSYFDPKTNIFMIDRECPFVIGDYTFHLEYDIKLKRIKIVNKLPSPSITQENYSYTAQYSIPNDRDVPTSTINSYTSFLNPPIVVNIDNENYIYLTIELSQVEHYVVSKKLITSNIIDNKIINFTFEDQLAYFEIHCIEQDEEYYITPVFEGSSIPESESKYYCWYQYIDTNLIRVRFDRNSYSPGLNTTVECLIKTTNGASGNFKYSQDLYVTLSSETYGYDNITCLLTPATESSGGKDKKSKKELQSLIPKEILSRGNLTTITDLNNYFNILNSEIGRLLVQKKIDNQIERVYYTYFVTKDQNNNIVPSNTLDIKISLNDLIKSQVYSTDYPKYILPAGTCFRLGGDGIAYVNDSPLIGSLLEFTPNSVSRGDNVEVEFLVEVVNTDPKYVSCGVSVEDCNTNTHVFPKPEDERYIMTESSNNTIVEDYIQMGVGRKYTYEITYVTKEDNSLISATDKQLQCFDFVEGYYIVDGIKHTFSSLPVLAYGIPKNTKIIFGITNRLNTKLNGLVYMNYNDSIYKYEPVSVIKLSDVLKSYGLVGTVTNAISDDNRISLKENGIIYVPEPPVGKYKLYISGEKNLPDVYDRQENEWFYVVESVTEENSSIRKNTDDIYFVTEPYLVNKVLEKDLPEVKYRKENTWYYVIEDYISDGTLIDPSTLGESSKEYELHVENENNLPEVNNRKENNWWYATHREEVYKEIEDKQDNTVLIGKEYDVKVLDDFQGTTIHITVTIDGVEYVINVTQDRNIIENSIILTENDNEVANTLYQTYAPSLSQNVWPEKLVKGYMIKYRVKYKSISNTYKPKLTVHLSEGLRYVQFSNKVIYPDGTIIQIEPSNVELRDNTEFIYTNPYAININGYKLYSSFYMMAVNENPFLYFDWVNDQSNIQFIASNINWNRTFVGNNTDQYTITCNIIQSVQSDLGLTSLSGDILSEDYYTPLVKAIVVFKKDGKPYRYRSMVLESYDPNTYGYMFKQTFNSKDIFDYNNHIKITNVQTVGQEEYNVTFSYGSNTYLSHQGERISLSDLLDGLDISITEEIAKVTSSNRDALDICKLSDTEYEIRSFNDFSGEIEIRIVDKENNEFIIKAVSTGPSSYKIFIGESYSIQCNMSTDIYISDILKHYGIEYTTITNATFNVDTNSIYIEPVTDDNDLVYDYRINVYRDFSDHSGVLAIEYDDTVINYEMSSSATEYGFFAPTTDVSIYILSGLPDIDGVYSKYNLGSICPGMDKWTVTNIYTVVNGVTMYHNYAEIMGSRCIPYGIDVEKDNNTVLDLRGYYIKSVPLLGYNYCKDEILAQNAIDALNYRKAYIDNALVLLENSFGIDFKLFNTYGPSKIYYIIRDENKDSVLNDTPEFIDSVNLRFYFRVKLLSSNDNYTKDNIISDIKDYIEDLNDISELHIPNLVSYITNKYSEQLRYFEYLGFNDYGPEIQHIYKVSDNEIPIDTAPEFLNISNVLNGDGTLSPDVTIYLSEM